MSRAYVVNGVRESDIECRAQGCRERGTHFAVLANLCDEMTFIAVLPLCGWHRFNDPERPPFEDAMTAAALGRAVAEQKALELAPGDEPAGWVTGTWEYRVLCDLARGAGVDPDEVAPAGCFD